MYNPFTHLKFKIMRARKLILGTTVALLFCISNLQAQYYKKGTDLRMESFGIRVAGNFATVNVEGVGDAFPRAKTIDGFNYAVFGEIPLVDGFSFQPELSYNKKGFRVKEGIDLKLFGADIPLGLEAHTEVKYLEAPLLGKYTLKNEKAGLYFLAGPSVSMATSAKLKTKARILIDFNLTKTDLDLGNDDYRRWEVAAVAGIGGYVNIGTTRLFVESRYNWGLTDLLGDPLVDVQLKNRVLGLGVGLQFAL